MILLKGKYNIARIMLPDDKCDSYESAKPNSEYKYLDEATKNQIQGFLNHPACQGKPIVIMPDAHAGKGSCVGFTFPLNEYILPNMVGVDVGCGIYSFCLGKIHIDRAVLESLDKYIRQTIPAGFSVHAGRTMKQLKSDVYRFRQDFTDEMWQVAERIREGNVNTRFHESLGTLGGGNHFIELGKDEQGDFWLTVHTGSRSFGLQVCNYHVNKARELLSTMFIDKNQHKGMEFLPMKLGGEDYLLDMEVAQHYAHANRMLILQKIVEGWFHQTLDDNRLWTSVHNYVDFNDKIIRKGAISAYDGEQLVIPFNMEDGLILGVGRGNSDWNFSAPHGAGRILSRGAAKKALSLEEAETGMKNAGVFTTSLSVETLDEAKKAYKPKELILEMIKDTVKVVSFVKPVYNFKAK